MLIDILILITAVLIVGCGIYSYRQFKEDYSNDCEKVVAESMAARSNKVVLDLADAYQLPDTLGMEKVRVIEKCREAVLQYESDYYLAVEEMEISSTKQDNVSFLRARP